MKLNHNWKIQSFEVGQVRDLEIASPGYSQHFWIPAAVPGDVHSTLIKKQIIEDPYYGHNDIKCRWVEEKVWWYKTDFQFNEEIGEDEWYELTFEGLDTYATVYLNGVELGTTENMFIAHTFDVTSDLRKGRNVVAVKFDPVFERVKDKERSFWSGFNSERIWARKAQMNFGWDWGPRLVTVGIWKDVVLEKRKGAKIESVFAHTLALSSDQADVQVDVEISSVFEVSDVTAEIRLSGSDQVLEGKCVLREPGGSLVISVPNPRLWWTFDLGEPFLYDLEVTLLYKDKPVDQYKTKFGIRTIRLSQKDEEGNHEFAFILNGVKMFAKGANWIPVDNFFAAASNDVYTKLIRLSKEANMNMLRVWGGGIYERDIFYQECDRLGLLVWQDFMFACSLYPDFNRNYMENVREEVVKVVKRLRNYSCLAIWCGNNENDWIYEKRYSTGEIKTRFYGAKIYHQLMPKLLKQLDDTRFYWPSSPFGGNDHNAAEIGDRHNWQVWHGYLEPRRFGEIPVIDYSVEGVSFKHYKNDPTLFSSEFGMHASANRHTLKSYIPKGEFYWLSDEMAYRNKDAHQPKGILLMEGYTGIPQNIEEYMNYSMLTQAAGLKLAVEHYRRNKPRTSGALIWQLNDCWPGTSWSMIDYGLLPKASYYYAAKFFHPILLTVDHEVGNKLTVYVVNDTLETLVDVIEVTISDFLGNIVYKSKHPVQVKANSVLPVTELPETILQGHPVNEVFMHVCSEKAQWDNIHFLRDPKDLRLPSARLKVEIDYTSDEIVVSTDVLAHFVKIELPSFEIVCSDNFFDMPPGTTRRIKIKHLSGSEIPYEGLRVSALNENRTT